MKFLEKIKKLLIRREEEEGQGFVEYGLILGLIAAVAIFALNATESNVNSMLQNISNTLDTTS